MKINLSRQKNTRHSELTENANCNWRGQGKKKYFCRWNPIRTWLDAAVWVLCVWNEELSWIICLSSGCSIRERLTEILYPFLWKLSRCFKKEKYAKCVYGCVWRMDTRWNVLGKKNTRFTEILTFFWSKKVHGLGKWWQYLVLWKSPKCLFAGGLNKMWHST